MTNENLGFWESQFQFSSVVPDYDDFLPWMGVHSQGIEAKLGLQRHSYGPDPRQWYEISTGVFGPVLPVFIHGGYWKLLTAEEHRFALPGLMAFGDVVANVEYRLIPDVRMGDVVADVIAALKAILDRAPDGTKLLVLGASAGGHLALASARAPELAGRIAGMVGISGVYDLWPVAQSYLQEDLNLSEAEVYEFTQSDALGDVPLLLVVGADETVEFQRQAEVVSALGGAPVLRVRDAHHMNITQVLARADTALVQTIGEWLRSGTCPAYVDGPGK